VTSSWFLTVERLLSAHKDLVTAARRFVAKSKEEREANPTAGSTPRMPSAEEFGGVFPEIASSPERMPFNVVCRGPQRFEWTEVPFDDLHVLKHAIGCTFNDVALTVVASTYRRYTEWRGASTRGRSLRIVVPVNTRPPEDDSHGMGNQITFVPISVPFGIRSPRKLMAAVHERMTMIKQARIAEMVTFAGALIAAIPSVVQMFLAPIAAQLPLTLCNLIFTNVPGPRHPLYVLGHKMLSAYPYVPIGGEMGSNCAMLTYNGKAHFGFSCDVHATPESRLLPRFLQESVAELREEIGVARRRSSTRPAAQRNKTAKAHRAKSNGKGELKTAAQASKSISETPQVHPVTVPEAEPKTSFAASA
jgi:WS/DGAT/MGAT family acyltransferase